MKTEPSEVDDKSCCDWAKMHPLLLTYHDNEWGVRLLEDNRIFEMLSLDCFQAGLSWLTILKKREAFLQAFDRFNIQKVARYDETKINELMLNTGIVRNRLKIPAIVKNARIAEKLQEEMGSFASYIWSFSEGKTIQNQWQNRKEVPATSPVSDAMSRDMIKRGFTFAGSTIIYAFMQSIGMVNDHLVTCHRHTLLRQ